MITREQVADLRPGDVVELSFPSGSTIRGTLTHDEYSSSGLGITDAHWTVRFASGEVPPFITGCSLTVVSRATRPLYVNSDRTEPVPGDVVRDADDEDDRRCWDYIGNLHTGKPWARVGCIGWDTRRERDELPTRLRLIVDGTTGFPPAGAS